MNPALFNSQFFVVALPIMVTFTVTAWASASTNNKRVDDLRNEMNHRFDESNHCLVEAREESIAVSMKSSGASPASKTFLPITINGSRAWKSAPLWSAVIKKQPSPPDRPQFLPPPLR